MRQPTDTESGSSVQLAPRQRWVQRHALAVMLSAALAYTALVGGLISLQPRSAQAQTIGDFAILSAAVLAVAGCLRAWQRGGPAARAWSVMAVAAAVWGAAMLLWTWYGLTRDHAYPFPSLADAGFLGYSVPLVVGLLLFPRSVDSQVARARVLLDGAVIAAAVLLISWATVLGPLEAAGGSGLTRRALPAAG